MQKTTPYVGQIVLVFCKDSMYPSPGIVAFVNQDLGTAGIVMFAVQGMFVDSDGAPTDSPPIRSRSGITVYKPLTTEQRSALDRHRWAETIPTPQPEEAPDQPDWPQDQDPPE